MQTLSDICENLIEMEKMYRLATILDAAKYLGVREQLVRSGFRRLMQQGEVSSHPFVDNQKIFRLTLKCCRKRGLSKRLAGPIGPQAMRDAYGALHFCVQGKNPRSILSQTQVAEILQSDEPLRGRFYLDEHIEDDGQSVIRLGQIFVDGGLCDASRILKKGISFLNTRSKNQAFRALVASEEFVFCFVTPSEGKRDAIEKFAMRTRFPTIIRLHVCRELAKL